MTRTRIYLTLLAVLCVLLAVLLCASAVTIYREGAARRAEYPLESIYTREIVAEKFAPLAPLCFTAVGLMLAGLVLGIRDNNAEKPAGMPEIHRDLIAARVSQPSDAMRQARSEQKRWRLAGRAAFSLSGTGSCYKAISAMICFCSGSRLPGSPFFTLLSAVC